MNIILNGQVQHVVDSSTVELVPRKSHGDYRLAANDRLEIVTLVGGG